ncbi:MAG: DMT family transporter [Planctomycetaceae bacterium]|jgi:drug/metabolite transporter (DMT)-like permease|nr:DMT family transporter [Planctomycetaceae bacterium]
MMNAILLAIGAGLCWGIGEVCAKSVLHGKEVGAFAIAGVRAVVALPLVLMAYWIAVPLLKSEPAQWYQAGPGVWTKMIIGSGVLAAAAGPILFYCALKISDISVVKPIAFTVAPATAALIGWTLLGEPVTPKKVIAVALILGGVVLLTTK